MSEINIVNRTQHIVIDPIISSVNVVEVDNQSVEDQVQLGSVLSNSFPVSLNTGNITSAAAEFPLWTFNLPAAMKVGDHARLRFNGSLGDILSGSAVASWYFRIYLNNVKVTEIYPAFTPMTGYGSTVLRIPFIQDIDFLFQAANSAYVWHRHAQGGSRPDVESTTTYNYGIEGTIHTMAAYANPAVNLANMPVKIAIQNGTAVSTNIKARGLTVEHLIAP